MSVSGSLHPQTLVEYEEPRPGLIPPAVIAYTPAEVRMDAGGVYCGRGDERRAGQVVEHGLERRERRQP
jgi:hypothetical protein